MHIAAASTCYRQLNKMLHFPNAAAKAGTLLALHSRSNQGKAEHVTVIDADAECVTLINTFVVKPENQQELIGLLDAATERVMRSRPGFISANIHRSLDGKRVVNYAQWRSKADFQAMLAEPACREHMSKAAALAESVEPVLYEVAAVRERWSHAALPYSADIFVSL